MSQQLKMFARLMKVDEAQRIVFGRIAQEVVDKSGEIFDYASSKDHFKAWSAEFEKVTDGKSLGNIRAMHGNVAAGKVVKIDFHDDECAIDVEAKIVDDNEWKKCLEGVYTGFSIGGKYEKRWADASNPKLTRYTAVPSETSIVDNPCGPTSTFTVVKADGANELRKFVEPKAPEKSTQELAAEKAAEVEKAAAADLAKLIGDGKASAVEILAAIEAKNEEKAAAEKALAAGVLRNALAAKATLSNGDVDALAKAHLPESERTGEPAELLGKLDAVAGPAETLGALLKALPEAPAADAVLALAYRFLPGAEVDAAIAQKAAPSTFLSRLRKVAAKEEAAVVEGDDAKFADPVNKKYPIDTPAHIRAAWNYINRPKATKAAGDGAKAIKARIVAAWKAKIDKDGPPSAEKFMTSLGLDASSLEKAYVVVDGEQRWISVGLDAVAGFAYTVQSLWNLARASALEQQLEGDTTSILPSRLEALAIEAGDILVEMVDEETREEAEMGKAVVAGLRKDLAPAERTPAQSAALLEHALTVVKAVTGKDHTEKMQKIHDHAADMGAACRGANAKATEAGELAKAAAMSMVKVAELLGAPKTETTDQIEKRVAETVRKAKLYDDQPAVPKGLLKAVAKGEEAESPTATELTPQVKELIEKAEKGDQVALMRLTHLMPQGAPPSSSWRR